jgi:hypothetical protein
MNLTRGLYLWKLLVLSFWVCGGAVAGAIVPCYLQRQLQASDPPQAARLVGGVLFWFSTAQTVLGASLFGLLFWLEREGRRTLLITGALVAITVVNEYIVASWMRNVAEGTAAVLHTVYVGLFVLGVLLALGLFVAVALKGPPRSAPGADSLAGAGGGP